MRRCSLLTVGITASLLAGCSPDDVVQPHAAPTLSADRADASDPTPSTISLRKIATLVGPGPVAAEITAFDDVSKRLFVSNATFRTVDDFDLKDPAAPEKIATLDLSTFGSSVNSVAAHTGVVAVAVQGPLKTDPGTIVFFRATTLERVSSVGVGALPDMVTFTPDGRTLLVANEGEPNDAYTVDPEGSVSVVDVHNINAPVARTASFGAYNGQEPQLRASGIRISGPNASVAEDFEPEYITTDADGRTAYLTLQENNAIAIVDIASATVQQVIPLGYKDHRVVPFDASDRDGPANGPAINIRTWPVPLLGMYQPDGIASYTTGGRTYLVTANEGDSRSWAGFTEDVYDITSPTSPSFVTYANSRVGALGDLAPEAIVFVPAVRSPNKHPLLIVGYEASGTVGVFEIVLQ